MLLIHVETHGFRADLALIFARSPRKFLALPLRLRLATAANPRAQGGDTSRSDTEVRVWVVRVPTRCMEACALRAHEHQPDLSLVTTCQPDLESGYTLGVHE